MQHKTECHDWSLNLNITRGAYNQILCLEPTLSVLQVRTLKTCQIYHFRKNFKKSKFIQLIWQTASDIELKSNGGGYGGSAIDRDKVLRSRPRDYPCLKAHDLTSMCVYI